ncbi:manganese efflux pump MntP family protein [Desnuesiella massiliensis]|uniref:manganese efflux pump MntP n=1 Tax=Desnuesiella massiliensis TaxID=1650662 RepID=UPI0006E1F1BC|nr:manganese efflux pump MntP family protein [Desnuesiella massiliensis]
MNLLSIVLIAFGLSMDAFAVSVTSGIGVKEAKVKNAFKIAFYFGLFQGLMPLIGWFIGSRFKDYITQIDHWVAFILLAVIGGKMIYEAIKEAEEEKVNCLTFKVLVVLAIATSIDALAVGISFAFLSVSILKASAIIACITFFICFAGVFLGKWCGEVFQKKAEIVGGVILLFIGFKILAEHLELTQLVMKLIQ